MRGHTLRTYFKLEDMQLFWSNWGLFISPEESVLLHVELCMCTFVINRYLDHYTWVGCLPIREDVLQTESS